MAALVQKRTREAGETYELRIKVDGSEQVSNAVPVRVKWNPPTGIQDAINAAEKADIAIVLAGTYTDYGDDRKNFILPDSQSALINNVAETNDNTIVLLNTESAVAMPWVDDVPAIMQLWFPGQEGGRAVANLLFGNANPAGKTPVTFGKSPEDYLPQEVDTLPNPARGYPGVNGNVYYKEGVFVSYRHFDEAGVEPLFPFGHGESYITFKYGKAKLSWAATAPEEGVTVSIDVTNTVDVELDADAFQYWDPEEEDWMVNYGAFDILIGASSHDIRIERTVRISEMKSQRGGGSSGRSPT